MIEKEILVAGDDIGVGNNPVAARTGKQTVMAIKLGRPKQLLGCAGPVVSEQEIAAQRGLAAGWGMPPIIHDVTIIDPCVMARVVVEIADIGALGRHRVGLEELVGWVLDKGDKAGARRVPAFAEEIKVA